MKKLLAYLLTLALLCIPLTGCQSTDDSLDDLDDTESHYNIPNITDDYVDYTGISADYDLGDSCDGVVSIEGRIEEGAFNLTPEQFRDQYNAKVSEDKHITKIAFGGTPDGEHSYGLYYLTIDEETGFLLQYLIPFDGTDRWLFGFTFCYPVASTQNGAFDYEEEIDAAMSVLVKSFSLEKMAEKLDVKSKEQNLERKSYVILREYARYIFEIIDGTGYLSVGTNMYMPDDLLYFIEHREDVLANKEKHHSFTVEVRG